jgi:hypothetical protein
LSKRRDLTGDWRKLHGVGLNDLYYFYTCLGKEIREDEVHASHGDHGDIVNTYKILFVKP